MSRRDAARWGPGLLVVLALSLLLPGGAASDDSRLLQVQERRRALEQELARLRGQEQGLLGAVEQLELEIRLRGEQLSEIRLVLRETNARMDETVSRLREVERSLESMRPVLAARARALYKLGELSYLRLLLSVQNPADMFQGYRFVTSLARRDRQQLTAFSADLVQLSELRVDLEQRTAEALALRSELQSTRSRLDADRRRKTQLLRSIVEKKEIHAAYIEELRVAEEKLQQLLAGLVEGEVTVPITVFKGTLPWPTPGQITVPFGRRKHPKFDTYTVQNGLEIAAAPDTPVHAVHEGTVVFADRFRGYGLMVVLDHGGKHHSLYAHLAEIATRPGRRVVAGETLGSVGAPGLEDRGLYFEMRFQGRPEDPAGWLKPH